MANYVFLVGNVGSDGELRSNADGNSVLKFSLATSKTWKGKDGSKEEKTEWHRISLWGKRAEGLAQYIVKGTKLVVTGEIRYGSYEKDGTKLYTTDIVANDIEFASSKPADAGAPVNRAAKTAVASDYPDTWEAPV